MNRPKNRFKRFKRQRLLRWAWRNVLHKHSISMSLTRIENDIEEIQGEITEILGLLRGS